MNRHTNWLVGMAGGGLLPFLMDAWHQPGVAVAVGMVGGAIAAEVRDIVRAGGGYIVAWFQDRQRRLGKP